MPTSFKCPKCPRDNLHPLGFILIEMGKTTTNHVTLVCPNCQETYVKTRPPDEWVLIPVSDFCKVESVTIHSMQTRDIDT